MLQTWHASFRVKGKKNISKYILHIDKKVAKGQLKVSVKHVSIMRALTLSIQRHAFLGVSEFTRII